MLQGAAAGGAMPAFCFGKNSEKGALPGRSKAK